MFQLLKFYHPEERQRSYVVKSTAYHVPVPTCDITSIHSPLLQYLQPAKSSSGIPCPTPEEQGAG